MNSIRAKIIYFFNIHHLRRATYLWLVMILLQVIFLVLKWHSLPPEVPLFYSRPWGSEQLTPVTYLVIFPLGSSLVAIVNASLAIVFFMEDRLVLPVLIWTTVVVAFLSCIGVFKIVFLIT